MLCSAAKDTSRRVRETAIWALANLVDVLPEPVGMLSMLLEAATDEDSSIRSEAVHALGSLAKYMEDQEPIREALRIAAYDSESPTVAGHAWSGLRKVLGYEQPSI